MGKEKTNIIYINVTIHDTSLAVKDKVTQKLRHTPKQLQKQASHVVSRFKTPARVAPILSKRLCKVVAERLSEKGICVKLEEYFREGPYIVLKLEVLRVDSQQLGRREIIWFTNNLGFKERIEDNLLPKLVKKQLKETMPSILEENFASSKISAESTVISERNQEAYFDAKIKEIREEEAKRKNANPLRIRLQRSRSSDEAELLEQNNKNEIKSRWNKRRNSLGNSSEEVIEQRTENDSKAIWNIRRKSMECPPPPQQVEGVDNKENQKLKWWARSRSIEKGDSSNTDADDESISDSSKGRFNFWRRGTSDSFEPQSTAERTS